MRKNRIDVAICAALLLTTVVLYSGSVRHQFITYDDPAYVIDNPFVTSGLTLGGVKWAFSSSEISNWHPLTWLSHMLDVELFGLDAGWHHATSVLFHSINALLLYVFLLRATGDRWPSLFVAVAFAWHPMHVESVAWVAERKDVLSAFFGFLMLNAYVSYIERPSVYRYGAATLFFVLGLMSKPMLVTFPVVLLIFDFWPFNRFEARPYGSSALPYVGVFRARYRCNSFLILEKAPLFGLSLASAAITLHVQQGAMIGAAQLALSERIKNAVVACGMYLKKLVWPVEQAIFYPHPGSWSLSDILVSAGVVVTISVLSVIYARRMPYLLVGWLFFLVTLAPVSGIVQVGAQSMAERYTYIPYTGLLIGLGWMIRELTKRAPGIRWLVVGSTGVVLLAYAGFAWNYLGYWKNGVSIFVHSLAISDKDFFDIEGVRAGEVFVRREPAPPGLAIPYTDFGVALMEKGLYEEAAVNFMAAISANPDFVASHYNLGLAFRELGHAEEAEREFSKARELNPSGQSLLPYVNEIGNGGGTSELESRFQIFRPTNVSGE